MNVWPVFHYRARANQRIAQIQPHHCLRIITDDGEILAHATTDIEDSFSGQLRSIDLFHISGRRIEAEHIVQGKLVIEVWVGPGQPEEGDQIFFARGDAISVPFVPKSSGRQPVQRFELSSFLRRRFPKINLRELA